MPYQIKKSGETIFSARTGKTRPAYWITLDGNVIKLCGQWTRDVALQIIKTLNTPSKRKSTNEPT